MIWESCALIGCPVVPSWDGSPAETSGFYVGLLYFFLMAAQHQHYVPKLLLRGFLSRDARRARQMQVHVFDFENERPFPASIDKIMGETRFNDFWVDEETLASIEPWTHRIESHVAPLVQRIRAEKTLERTSEEFGDLSLLVAFQFLRTKGMRMLPERLDAQMREHVRSMGLDATRIQGLFDLDAEGLKRQHIRHQLQSIQKYTEIIAEKEFFLMTAPAGHSFYIGDNPVVLHNDEPKTLHTGQLGIAADYIQIYLPLSSDVLLCAYDRAVLVSMMKAADADRDKFAGYALAKLMAGHITAAQMKNAIETARDRDPVAVMIKAIKRGQPIAIGPEQVQFYNSLQALFAHRFVIDPDDSFAVARDVIGERKSVARDQ